MRGQLGNVLSLSGTPIETLELIGENSSGDRKAGRNENLERVTFDLVRDRREHCQA
jgi:hypothetical protein